MSAGAVFNVTGLAVCAFVYLRRATSAGLRRSEALDAALLGVIGALVGARLGAGLFWQSVDVTAMLRGQSGAMSWGAYAGGFLAASARLSGGRGRWLRHVDAAAPAVLLGIAIARLGCFAEGDDFGTVCHYAWCVQFGEGSDAFDLHRKLGWLPPGAHRSLSVQPLQLYFSCAAAMAAFVVLLCERRTVRVRTAAPRTGSTALVALLLYTASRAPLESLRETADRGASGGVSSLQLAGFQFCIALALGLAWWACSPSARWRARPARAAMRHPCGAILLDNRMVHLPTRQMGDISRVPVPTLFVTPSTEAFVQQPMSNFT